MTINSKLSQQLTQIKLVGDAVAVLRTEAWFNDADVVMAALNLTRQLLKTVCKELVTTHETALEKADE